MAKLKQDRSIEISNCKLKLLSWGTSFFSYINKYIYAYFSDSVFWYENAVNCEEKIVTLNRCFELTRHKKCKITLSTKGN